MADENRHRYLFVAIDRATRWGEGYPGIDPGDQFRPKRAKPRTLSVFARSLQALERSSRTASWPAQTGCDGEHEFDKLCSALNIEHRLTAPKSPQTNGMVEHFNGRIEEVLQSHHYGSGEELKTTLHRYVR